ncbi:MAG: acetamidase/formamidase family protein [Betaproteobacteria bacterium]
MPDIPRRNFLAGAAALAGAPLLTVAADAPSSRPEIAALSQGRVGQYQSGVYLLPATDETVQWGWFDNAEPPRARIRDGDTVVMETQMASLNRILPGMDVQGITKLRVDNPGRGPHTITGPIYVEGAMPGDALEIRINRIVPRSYGANWNLPGPLKLGQFPEVFTEPQVKWFYFDLARRRTEFLPGIEIPIRPFPGILGVARAEPGRHSTVPPGPFGGNLAIRELGEGTTLHLPVFVDGALLWSGDSHAAQGNGEINLTAIETAFSELSLTVKVRKGAALAWPRIETPTHWLTTGYDRSLNRAHELLVEETVKFLREWRGLSGGDALRWMQQHGDVRVAEVVNQVKGLYCLLPKRLKDRPAARPAKDVRGAFVTVGEDGDLMQAMNRAAMPMIERLQAEKGLSALDAYSLASLAMDTRVGRAEAAGGKTVHCLLPLSLWVSP